jgi:succinate dehydrogenase / fumarate reductase, cytochrome b subunit
MSTRALTKRQVVTNSVPSHQGLADWVQPRLRSSVGGKYVVAVTGLILTSFVVVHMLGNLQVFLGSDAINAYAAFLKGHPVLLWTARVVLFITFLVHIGVALWLNWKARRARPIGYARKRTVQASFASRHMVITGLFVLVFTGFHIAHFTLGVVTEAEVKPAVTAPPGEAPAVYENYLDLRDPSDPKRHDVYAMMIYGFRNPIVAGAYILAQVFLFLHLVHGVASMFQTVGLNSPRAQGLIRRIALAVAILVCGGNVGIVAGVASFDSFKMREFLQQPDDRPKMSGAADGGDKKAGKKGLGGMPPLPKGPPPGFPLK